MSSPLLIGTLIFLVLAITFIVVLLHNKYNKNSIAYYHQQLLQVKLEIQEQTFKTVSSHIHDNIGQILSLAKLNLNRIDKSRLISEDEQKLNHAKDLISNTIKELRNLSRTLNANNINNIGLLQAMEMELQLLQKNNQKEVNLKVEGKVERLDTRKEYFLFRIFQEALYNINNHTSTSIIQVIVIFKAKSFEFVITDNGHGIADSVENNQEKVLHNMQSRAKLIGATLQQISTPETGTKIYIHLSIT